MSKEIKENILTELDGVNRIEVIDHSFPVAEDISGYKGGRVYSKRQNDIKIEATLQDKGRTLKVFISKNE